MLDVKEKLLLRVGVKGRIAVLSSCLELGQEPVPRLVASCFNLENDSPETHRALHSFREAQGVACHRQRTKPF
jgi:hypothetical protein